MFSRQYVVTEESQGRRGARVMVGSSYQMFFRR